jgi:hypothetical protein
MSKHKSHVACAILVGAIGAASVACGGNRGATQQASTAGTKGSPTAPGPSQHATHGARTPPSGTLGSTQPQGAGESEADDAELVVGREVIQQCPQLVLVRSHMGDIDPDQEHRRVG